MISMRFVLPLAALACAPAFAQGVHNNPHLRFSQEHHWTFSEIGDVGNKPYVIDKGIGFPPRIFGGVDHRYRISTTEVSWGQYYEFVQAYAPHTQGNLDSSLAAPGGPIRWLGNSGGVSQYEFHQPERVNQPAFQSWQIWARFCNWLNAGGPDLADPAPIHFENGAYDTSTFGRISEGPSRHIGPIKIGTHPDRSSGSLRTTNSPRRPTTTPTRTARARAGTGATAIPPTTRLSPAILRRAARPTRASSTSSPRTSSGRAMSAVTPMCNHLGACSTLPAGQAN